VIVDGKDEGRNSYVDALRLSSAAMATLLLLRQWKNPLANVTEENDHPPQVGLAHVVVDGKPGKSYEEIIPGSLGFTEDGSFRYAARDGRKFLRVSNETTIEKIGWSRVIGHTILPSDPH